MPPIIPAIVGKTAPFDIDTLVPIDPPWPAIREWNASLPQQQRRGQPERETAFARAGHVCSGRGWHGNKYPVLRKQLKITHFF